MTTFWIIVAVFTLFILLLLLLPLLRSRRNSTAYADRSTLNIAIIRERMAELETELAQQRISEQQYQILHDELKLALARDLEMTDQASTAQPQAVRSPWLAGIISLVLPIAAVLLYLNYGDERGFADKLTQQTVASKSSQGPAGQPPNQQAIAEMVQGLADRLKTEPNDPQGWSMLGRSYMVMGRYAEAATAYAELRKLVGEEVNVLLQLAQARVMSNQGQWDAESIQMITSAVEKEPNNTIALSLAGMIAVNRGEKQQAIKAWQHALTLMKPDSAEHKELSEMLAALSGKALPARAQASAPVQQASAPIKTAAATTTSSPASVTVAEGHAIEVRVSLAPELKAQAKPNQTLFIYAQALSGPPMPIAVSRLTVADLPVTVVLDDTMAMMPTRKLSSFKEVRVGARISQTGSAMPGPGDMQGRIEPVIVGKDHQVSVMIQQVL